MRNRDFSDWPVNLLTLQFHGLCSFTWRRLPFSLSSLGCQWIESTTSLRWCYGGNVASVGWQVKLCDPRWPVSSSGAETTVDKFARVWSHLTCWKCYHGSMAFGRHGRATTDCCNLSTMEIFERASQHRVDLLQSIRLLNVPLTTNTLASCWT